MSIPNVGRLMVPMVGAALIGVLVGWRAGTIPGAVVLFVLMAGILYARLAGLY